MPDPYREISEVEVRAVLPRWDVGELTGLPGERGGTANPAVAIETERGRYFLRRRNPRYADPAVLAHDHALMEHLAERAFPTPLAARSRDGQRWVVTETGTYELYPYVPGEPHDPRSLTQIAEAAGCLARFHEATADFAPPRGKAWPRYHSPSATIEALQWAESELAPDPSQAAEIAELARLARDLGRRFSDDAYHAGELGMVHGDWHPANVKYAGGRIVGVFDLDWATRQPRLVDIADGLIFFAGVRERPFDGGDIRSLTQSFRLDPERTATFLRAYVQARRPQARALGASGLADFMLARWLYCRADPMRRKLPRDAALGFLLDGIWEPVDGVRSMTLLTLPFA